MRDLYAKYYGSKEKERKSGRTSITGLDISQGAGRGRDS